MNTTTANYLTPILLARPSLLQRCQRLAAEAWLAWRERARARSELRALQGLSDATLRDIGLAERVLGQPQLSAFDYERGRW